MLRLESIDNSKTVEINGKKIKIPKLGLYHYQIIKDPKNLNKATKELVDTIHKGLSKAERDLVMFYLLEHNGKLKPEADVSKIKIVQQLKFEYNGFVFKFKTPTEDFSDPIKFLEDSCVSVTKNGQKVDFDFGTLPAYAIYWIDKITTTLSLEQDGKTYNGIGEIMELLCQDL